MCRGRAIQLHFFRTLLVHIFRTRCCRPASSLPWASGQLGRRWSAAALQRWHGKHALRADLTDADANLSAAFGFAVLSPPADRTVKEGDIIEIAGLSFRVLEIPGHSPGHVVFVHEGTPIDVFGGDVLFRGSIGRYDFPNGNGPLLLEGIRRELFALPADTVVYPGHGPVTTVGYEMQTNPFLSES